MNINKKIDSRYRKLVAVVFEIVSRQTGVPRERLHQDSMLNEELGVDQNMHSRILFDIESQLGLNPLEGNWSFENASINALINYYDRQINKDGKA